MRHFGGPPNNADRLLMLNTYGHDVYWTRIAMMLDKRGNLEFWLFGILRYVWFHSKFPETSQVRLDW